MGKISFLSQTLQNQIAAGEVVERPASIVKELLENSADAGATEILLEIFEGGIKKIRLVDNGCGMGEEDASLALQRYATSKLKTVDDLFSLRSFGFRGEALASIASVSHCILRTKQENEPHGWEVKNGEKPWQCACPKGTEICVENVFWNVPARRKFLKAENVEAREIVKIFEKFALSHPELALKMKKDGKDFLLFSARTGEQAFENRVVEVLGNDVTSHLLPLHFLGSSIRISGFCTHPNFHRSSRDRQFLFVNSRMVSVDKGTAFAISEAYERLLPNGKFPAFVLCIDLDPDLVDVNVHPRKTEVKFLHTAEIVAAVKNAFSSALAQSSRAERENEISHFPSRFTWNAPVRSSFSSALQTVSSPKFFPSFPTQIFLDQENAEVFEKKYRIVGQLRNAFIVVEEKNGMRVIDQHAAHERIRYEKLKNDFLEKKVESQPLLAPIVFGISASEKMRILEEKNFLEQAGFAIDDFGGQEIAISAVPAGCEKIDFEKLFRNLLDDLDVFDRNFLKQVHSFTDRLISYAACRGAVKFGDALSLPEMENLVEYWLATKTPDACAHGRPVSTFFPYQSLENDCGR